MGSLPPHLLYLIIYNPTLRPSASASADDEDAQEQAHVLFYTANDHAVSKDRVLRQVGLAKALANFTTIFDTKAACESVHSQSRRMIMVSPEPDFWIHACFELEKVPRTSKKEEKGKVKQKDPVYDYNDASLHDTALRTQLLMGYESFKLIHGSFTSILKSLNKEALELQLERFFTVWAWSWDLNKQASFADYLGIRVHPLSTQLMPLIDILEDKLPAHYFPVVLISSCLVASKSIPHQGPPVLTRYLLRILESRKSAPSRRPTGQGKGPENSPPEEPKSSASPPGEINHTRTASKTFLGVPALSMNVNVDVRKWLTFGLAGSSSGTTADATNADDTQSENTPLASERACQTEALEPLRAKDESNVDAGALEDALSSETTSQFSLSTDNKTSQTPETPSDSHRISPRQELVASRPINSKDAAAEVTDPEHRPASITGQLSPKLRPSPSFSELRVYLSYSDPLDTQRRLVRYLCTDDILLALVPCPERPDDALDQAVCQDLVEKSIELVDRLKDIVEVEQKKIASAFSSSPIQNVLQKSQYVVSTHNQLTYSSLSFSASSWHLYEGKKALTLYPGVQEIYSRGQSPQDWHLVKRGNGTGDGTNERSNSNADVYMEIGRKEASLVDVDNEITGVLRRFAE